MKQKLFNYGTSEEKFNKEIALILWKSTEKNIIFAFSIEIYIDKLKN